MGVYQLVEKSMLGRGDLFVMVALLYQRWFLKQVGATVNKMGNSHITRTIKSLEHCTGLLFHSMTRELKIPIVFYWIIPFKQGSDQGW